MKLKLLLLILIAIPSRFIANTCTSTAGTFASWASLTWTCTSTPTSGPPGCGDVMNVAAGTIVNISADVDYSGCASPIQLNIYGVINFNTGGVRFKLPAGSTVTVELGGAITKTFVGGGSSTLISVGGTNVWTGSMGTIVGPVVLPIELLDFVAKPNLNSVSVQWSTASELNNDFYTVERSTNGVDFQPVGTVDGSGTTNWVMNYSFEDISPVEGISYYRLRQTDFDNHTATFNVAAVEYHAAPDFSLTLFPNPSDGDNVSLVINAAEQEHIAVTIFDLLGKVIYSKELITAKRGNNTFGLELGQRLVPGMYSVSCASEKNAHVQKLVIK
ncbi:MAG: T9SS type A sorting domain-containing protein [Bacteroidia bacterium]